MSTRREKLSTKALRALSRHPNIIQSLPESVVHEAKNELANYIKKTLTKKNRWYDRKDIYYGSPNKLTRGALIRNIQQLGFANNYIVDLLRIFSNNHTLSNNDIKITLHDPTQIFDYLQYTYVPTKIDVANQNELLDLLSKKALQEIYNSVATREIAAQRRKGQGFDRWGGKKSRKLRKLHKSRKKYY